MTFNKLFASFADRAAKVAGKPLTFLLSVALVVAWAVSGPVFRFSDTWQLVINTGTTIITFLMVFVIQNSQNRDGAAIQAKLDELIRASAAQNRFIGIEMLTEDEVAALRSGPLAQRLSAAAEAADIAEERAQEKSEAAGRQASA